jgi:hypothetical protein
MAKNQLANENTPITLRQACIQGTGVCKGTCLERITTAMNTTLTSPRYNTNSAVLKEADAILMPTAMVAKKNAAKTIHSACIAVLYKK